jgi:hypothetical protein
MTRRSQSTRRQFLQTSLAAGAFGLTIPALAGPTVGGKESARIAIPCGKAPFKVLYNNDTTHILTCASPYHSKTSAATTVAWTSKSFTPEMLEASVDETAGTGIDVHLLQPGLCWVPWWKSKAYPFQEHVRFMKEHFNSEPSVDGFAQYMADGGDLVGVFVKRCREKGLKPFISFRLNDSHGREVLNSPRDRGSGIGWSVLCPALVEHPEWRIGSDLHDWKQRPLNWAIPEVRQLKFRYIRELIEQYDLEGFELDFLRFPSFFRPNETTSQQRHRIMNRFVRDVRRVLDDNTPSGHRRWLSVRIPCYQQAHDALGIDVRAFAEAGVDMFNLSAYYFTEQQTDAPAIKRLLPGSAVYAEMTHTTCIGPSLTKTGGDNFLFRRTTDEQFYTTAHLAYARGLNGVSTFNFVYYRKHGTAGRGPFREPPFHVFKHLRDPAWLARQPQHYILATVWNEPPVPRQLPRRLKPGQSAEFRLDMSPPTGGWTKDGKLRIQSKEPMGEAHFTARFNGKELSPIDDLSEPYPNRDPSMLATRETARGWSVPAQLPADGVNRLIITMRSERAVEVMALDLAIA